MKKNFTIIIFLFITGFCYSQRCLSEDFLNQSKINNPKLDKKIKDIIFSFKNNEQNITNKTSLSQVLIGDEIIVIPVVFNVIHSGEALGTGKNISLIKIEQQINIMNEAYSGKYGGIDTRIRFCLAKQNTVGQITTGVNRFIGNSSYDMGIPISFNPYCTLSTQNNYQIKRNISPGFPSNLFLNIWTTDLKFCGADTVLGFSSSPFDGNTTLDGVVLDYLQVGINVTSDPNNPNNSNGSTATHEVGHWLGLFHVFSNIACNETNCETEGDMICDTDAVPDSGINNIVKGGNCLGYNCKGQTTNVVQNFMDYQDSSRLYCQTKFTAGQKKRMRDILSFYRSSIYSQGSVLDLTACKATSYGGGGGGCTEDVTLPVQRIPRPNIYQDLSQFASSNIKFGERLEINDKWLVTIYNTTAYYFTGTPIPTTPPVNTVLIYKREGCKYALHQMIDIPLNNSQKTTDFGLLLNGNEIIIGSALKDKVTICRLNQSNDTWSIVQQIENISSTAEVGSSTYTVGKFLFILENNSTGDNIFRVYYKNDNGMYVFHQNIAIPGFSLPRYGKYIQSGNFRKTVVNFNSSTFIGSYDPFEILVSKSSGTGLVLLELNNNNMWTYSSTIQPVGMPTTERTYDIELSKDYIHILTSANTTGAPNHDVLYLYSYKITDISGTNFPFQSSYNKQTIISTTDGISFDTKLQVFNDQFLFIDNIRSQPITLFYNSNYGSSNFPNWQKKAAKKIACANSIENADDFEVFGNLLFYGNSEFLINVYNMQDILTREGFDQAFIDNSDFYNKKINIVPDNYSTSAQKITIGETSKVEFNYVDKEFIANNNIVLKPGTRIARGSKVKLKITDSYGLCNSIVAKKSNDELDFTDEHLIEAEPEKNITLGNKVVLYPNPNTGVFTVYLGRENDKPISCNIYNSSGNLLYQAITVKSSIEISLPNLSAGNYILKLKGDNYNEVIKFIKE